MSVHVAIMREVLPGKESEFESAIREFFHESFSEPGVETVHLVKPAVDSERSEYGILRSFRDQEAMDAFYGSDRFAEWQRRVEPLVVGEHTIQKLHGLEAFFPDGPSNRAPRWKMAILTWLAVFISVNGISATLGRLTSQYFPKLMASAVNIGVVVILMTWILMPLITKIFKPWLHSPKVSHS